MAQEHVQLIYRQFLVVLGAFVFPLITIFAVAASLLECVPLMLLPMLLPMLMPMLDLVMLWRRRVFWDKLRLVYLCKIPTRKERPLNSHSLFVYHILVFLLALLTFPNGLIWVLREYDLGSCMVFQ